MTTSSAFATVLVNILAASTTIQVLRRPPAQHLRHLVWTAGILSTAQVANLLYSLPGYQWIVAICSTYAFYLILRDSRYRAATGRAAGWPKPSAPAAETSSSSKALMCIRPRKPEVHVEGVRFFIDLRGRAFDQATIEPEDGASKSPDNLTGLSLLAHAVGTSTSRPEGAPAPASALTIEAVPDGDSKQRV